MPDLDLDAIAEKWLKVCGACDAGLPMACTCAEGDHRPVISRLVEEVRRLRLLLGSAVIPADKAIDLLARAGAHINRIDTRTREDRDILVFVQDQIHAAMLTLDPKLGEVPDSPGGRCDWCKRKPCEVCAGNGCGDCPECSPHVPEVDD